MAERITPQGGEHTPFVPEDWDGHTQEDDCSWQDDDSNLDEFIREYRMADEIAKPLLTRFLASPDRTALRRYKRGEPFRIDRFSQEAIVRFTLETQVLGELESGTDPHRTVDLWGVVCALPNGRTVLMRYVTEFSNPLLPAFTHKGDRIDPEVTIHQRYKSGYSDAGDALIRYKDLALYSSGKTAPEPEKERGRFKLPNFGSIFRLPVPQPA